MSWSSAHRLHGYEAEYCGLIVSMFEGVRNYFTSCDATPLVKDTCADNMYLFLSSLDHMNTLWCHGLVTDDQNMSMPFHIRPKCHMVQHLVEDQLDLWGSPRNFNCYMDEHFIGGMKSVCAMSKHPHTI